MMEIRLLGESDAASWWRLRKIALETDPTSFAESPAEHEARTLEQTREYFRGLNPENFVVGAFEDGELAGMAGFYRENHAKFQHKGRIWGVHVRRESRRQGVARAMMEEIIAKAQLVEGIEQVTLTAAASQLPARQLYFSLGFRTYGVEPRSLKVRQEYIDDELMVLFL